MNKKNISLIFLLLLVRVLCNAQAMDFEKNLEILNEDYGTCYTIGDYMLCPDKEVIKTKRMFGTATKDCIGYFPDSTLKYNEVTLIIFAGQVFFDNSGLNVDWSTAKLLFYRDGYAIFTDGKILYHLSSKYASTSGEPYDVNTYKPTIENRLEYRKDRELTEDFSVRGGKFYFDGTPILEKFNVPNLRTIISKSGFESNYITDGKQVIFGGGKTGSSVTKKNGIEYVLAEQWMIEGVDLPSVRVLGRNLIADKNALYYCEHIIPFDKLNGLKIIIREL